MSKFADIPKSNFKDEEDVVKTLIAAYGIKERADIRKFLEEMSSLVFEFECPKCKALLQFTYSSRNDVLMNCEYEVVSKSKLLSGLVPCGLCLNKRLDVIEMKLASRKFRLKQLEKLKVIAPFMQKTFKEFDFGSIENLKTIFQYSYGVEKNEISSNHSHGTGYYEVWFGCPKCKSPLSFEFNLDSDTLWNCQDKEISKKQLMNKLVPCENCVDIIIKKVCKEKALREAGI